MTSHDGRPQGSTDAAPGGLVATAARIVMGVETCRGTLYEPISGDLQCSLGERCVVVVSIRTYYATGEAAIVAHIRAAHPDWQTGWVQAG
jgi:hypothetical protein